MSSALLQVWDVEMSGGDRRSGPVEIDAAAITTLRDLIRARVRQEVERYNARQPETFQGLVQPEESERVLNGYRLATRKPLDWERQFERACASFERNGFLVLAGGRQMASLDEPLDVSARIEFVKLLPLIGG